jgi:secondary thiamine-phosphate synthase enzyme
MEDLKINTKKKKEVIDITSEIKRIVKEKNTKEGICEIFILHTTCCLTTADLDPETDKDYLKAIEKMFPSGNYQHPHNPKHVGDHIMSSIIGNSVSIPIESEELILGTWQRVVLIELNGPRQRNLKVSIRKTN